VSALTSSLLRWTASGLHAAHLSEPLSRALGYASAVPTFPILSYHRVNDEGDSFFPSLSTEVFERQMAFVARAYVVLSVEELAERMRRRAVPRNALAITFDDGYRDNLTHAAPILARLGLPATVFLVTGAIASGEPLWFDRLAAAFKQVAATPAWRAPWGESLPLETQAQRLAALGQTLGRFKRLVNEERRRSVDQVLLTLGTGDERPLKSLMLSWDDVLALAGLGITSGAHTVSHPILSQLAPEEARAEIFESYRMIANACNRPPRAFAYPNGRPEDYSQAIAALVREAGFTCAVTTTFGVNTMRTPPYGLHRGGPWEPHLPTFALKLAGYRLTEA
jgi:peptidoglycan/xylan/chitin deacetylase (PgdA/CDA1 family)